MLCINPYFCCYCSAKADGGEKNLQGVGIGAAIIKYPENLTKEKGDKIIMMHALDVVIPFYKKCGYQVYDEPFTEAGISHHKMRKQLL